MSVRVSLVQEDLNLNEGCKLVIKLAASPPAPAAAEHQQPFPSSVDIIRVPEECIEAAAEGADQHAGNPPPLPPRKQYTRCARENQRVSCILTGVSAEMLFSILKQTACASARWHCTRRGSLTLPLHHCAPGRSSSTWAHCRRTMCLWQGWTGTTMSA